MTEDVLTLFQFDVGEAQQNIRRIYLLPWLQSLLEAFEESDRVVLDVQVSEISADEGLLWKIASNLVGNALKYSEEAVFVSVVTESGGVRLSVKDSGIGIPPSMRLFKAFERGSNVGSVGGTIEVDSCEGMGTEVVVMLPG